MFCKIRYYRFAVPSILYFLRCSISQIVTVVINLAKTVSENDNVEDSAPSKPKRAKKEKLEVPPTRVVIKRGTKLKSEDFESVEENKEPLQKQGRAKVESKKKDETGEEKGISKKVKASAEDVADNSKELAVKKKPEKKEVKKKPEKKEVKKLEKTEVKEKKTDKITVKKDTKKKVLKDNSTKKVGKNDVPTTSDESHTKKNNTVTDWKTIKFDTEKKNIDGNLPNFKIVSWNVGGMKAWISKNGLEILDYGSPDILCVQETKCSDDQLPEELSAVEGYHKFWCSSQKKGYAGVGLFTKEEPVSVTYGIGNEEQDVDGRCLTAEYAKFYLINVYVPNADLLN
ncbi:hypothetical protein WA026_001994 [Henosepilachna vigintioctopunctata]|uniref:exodeoxyribonuclease III n=1 Tax=Henosepilachna vigintioctopunctata TaxID=420089 RepID=A0AAW1URV5_9CUCU